MHLRVAEKRVLPFGEVMGVIDDLKEAKTDDDYVEEQIDRYQNYSQANSFFEPLDENGSEECNQQERNANLVLERLRSERIFDDVSGCISRRKRDGNNEVCTDKAKQHKNEEFAFPAGQQMLEHRN